MHYYSVNIMLHLLFIFNKPEEKVMTLSIMEDRYSKENGMPALGETHKGGPQHPISAGWVCTDISIGTQCLGNSGFKGIKIQYLIDEKVSEELWKITELPEAVANGFLTFKAETIHAVSYLFQVLIHFKTNLSHNWKACPHALQRCLMSQNLLFILAPRKREHGLNWQTKMLDQLPK